MAKLLSFVLLLYGLAQVLEGRRLPAASVNDDEVRVENWDDLCAKDETEMQRLYEDNLEQDLYYWRNLLKGGKLNRTHLLNLFDTFGKSRNKRGAVDYVSSQNNVVLIKDNHWYMPFRPFEYDASCNKMDTWCDARIRFSQWSFERWTKQLNITFPDVVFYHDIGDAGGCLARHCAAPMFSYFKQRAQMGFKDQTTIISGDSTILMPSLYIDVEKDALEGNLQLYSLYSYPWEKKVNKAVFRGSGWCPAWHKNKITRCPRWHLANQSIFNGYGNYLDVNLNSWTSNPPLPHMDSIPIKEHAKYKYVLSLDGVAASNRFAKLLGLNSVVLKEDSPYLGHFYRSIQPYEHYLPIFLRHADDWLDVYETFENRDAELQRIANNAQRFAAKYLCDRAIALYFRRALQGYKDLFGDMQEFIDDTLWPLVREKQKLGINYTEHRNVIARGRGQ